MVVADNVKEVQDINELNAVYRIKIGLRIKKLLKISDDPFLLKPLLDSD